MGVLGQGQAGVPEAAPVWPHGACHLPDDLPRLQRDRDGLQGPHLHHLGHESPGLRAPAAGTRGARGRSLRQRVNGQWLQFASRSSRSVVAVCVKELLVGGYSLCQGVNSQWVNGKWLQFVSKS